MAQVSVDNSSWHTFVHHEQNTNEFVKQTFLHGSPKSSVFKVSAGRGRKREREMGDRLMMEPSNTAYSFTRVLFRSQLFAKGVDDDDGAKKTTTKREKFIYVKLFRPSDALLSISTIHFN